MAFKYTSGYGGVVIPIEEDFSSVTIGEYVNEVLEMHFYTC